MRHPRRGNRATGRRSRTRGAALVEATLVLPLLVLLVFGVVELGLLIDTATVTSNAARNGARLASANYADAENAAERQAVLTSVRVSVEESLNALRANVTPLELWIYEANADGYPGGSGFDSCSGSCIRYAWDGERFSNPTGSWTDPQACGVELDRVGVYVKVRHEYLSRIIGAGHTIGEHTVMRLEPRIEC